MHARFRIPVEGVEVCVAANGAVRFSCAASAAHFLYKGKNMKKLCLFLAIIMICCTFSACGNTNNGNDIDTEVTEAPKIEERSELIEIMGGVMDVDVSTLWAYHFMLNEPYYISGYVVPDAHYSSRGFVLGDSDYRNTTPTIDVMDNHFDESEYEEGSFVYIKALPNGQDGVFLREISDTETDNDYLSVEEYSKISKTVSSTYFEVTGFIGSVTEDDGSYICKLYESVEKYKDNDVIDWGITLYFDEYPSNINGQVRTVVGEYCPIGIIDEPILNHCSIIDD